MGVAMSILTDIMAPASQFHDAVEQNKSTWEQVKAGYKAMPPRMWSYGKGFAKVAALYGFTECSIEKVCTAFHSSLSFANDYTDLDDCDVAV